MAETKVIKAITMLKNKLNKLHEEEHKYDGYDRLPRKIYFTDAKRQVRIGEQCVAIKAALEILNGKLWHELDIYDIVLMSVNFKNEDKEQMLYLAFRSGLYGKYKALTFAFEHSLPICKRQVLNAIQMQIKSGS